MKDHVAPGREGIEWVSSCLSRGRSFSRTLLRSVTLSSGSPVACVPEGADGTRLTDFEHGGLVPPGQKAAGSADGALASLIMRDLLAARRICLLEDGLAKPSDPWLRKAGTEQYFLGDDVFHFMVSGRADEGKVLKVLRAAKSLPISVGAICGISPQVDLPPADRELTQDLLEAFASAVVKIFVGAYDGEGYVVWNP